MLAWTVALTYLGAGALAGVIAGLLGLGGGIVVVPVLYFVFQANGLPAEVVMHLAVGSSLATIIVTGSSSALAHHRRGAVRWPVVAALAPGILVGTALGAAAADWLPGSVLRRLFGAFELFVAWQMFRGFQPSARRLAGRLGLAAGGVVIGALSTMLGIGGGTLTVPFLLWSNLGMREAVGISSACGVPIAVAGTIGLVIAGLDDPLLPAGATGYVYWPAVAGIVVASVVFARVGARLAHTLPVVTLRRVFAALLVLVGARMLW